MLEEEFCLRQKVADMTEEAEITQRFRRRVMKRKRVLFIEQGSQ